MVEVILRFLIYIYIFFFSEEVMSVIQKSQHMMVSVCSGIVTQVISL